MKKNRKYMLRSFLHHLVPKTGTAQALLVRTVLVSSILAGSLSGAVVFPMQAKATESTDYDALREERKELPIQSNTISAWPAGPQIGAQAAILMDIDTGVILYAKNIHERLYPASTTKMLTCLLAMEHGNLDDMVTFSNEAVFSVPRDGSNIGMDVGQAITLEECLYGILVGSANEAANAAGEYVAGSMDAFVDMMNDKAIELGCTDSHFCNANGLFDEDHYTSAYDLALIGREFFKNEMLCKIGNTDRYHFEPTATQPDDFYLKNKHQLITGEVPYKGIMGGKTGYTDEARQTLVTGCEQNGMRLVCVILQEESPYQFSDTATLFDYGFSNFSRVKVADNDTRYAISNTGFFDTQNDVFGCSDSFLRLDPEGSIILPNQATLEDTRSTVTYGEYNEPDKIAEITYTFQDTPIGTVDLLTDRAAGNTYHFNSSVSHNLFMDQTVDTQGNETVTTIFLNVKNILLCLIVVTTIVFFLILLISAMQNTHFSRFVERRKRLQRRKRWK